MGRGAFQAVFLDVDGVLLDSLPQHLAICAEKADAYGLHLRIPDVAAFRRLVAEGVKVSPMYDFFRAVGFPGDVAVRATKDYEREFMQRTATERQHLTLQLRNHSMREYLRRFVLDLR